MKRLITLSVVLALAGCAVAPYTDQIEPVRRPIQIYQPVPVIPYYGSEYYYYGPRVSIMLPNIIWGNGWRGEGYYHRRPEMRYRGDRENHWIPFHGRKPK